MSYVEERLREIAEEIRAGGPKKNLQPLAYSRNIERSKSRHGKTVLYYRERKGRRTRLPDPDIVGPEEFMKAYDAAASGKPLPIAKPKRAAVNGQFLPIGKPGYVYFVRNGQTVKIGFTTGIKQRIRTLQIGAANDLELLMVTPGTSGTEQFFHHMFRDHRIAGEWFSLTGLLADFLGHSQRHHPTQ